MTAIKLLNILNNLLNNFIEKIMADWEFLLQQEGDRTWLPLETAEVEILEGRYRIAGRCRQVNTAVQVQVTYRALEEENRIRRSPVRQVQTNGEGLMLVIPFTRFRPGCWDITCQIAPDDGNNQNNDQKTVNSQYTIQVSVLATDEEVDTADVEEFGETISVQETSVINEQSNISQSNISADHDPTDIPQIEKQSVVTTVNLNQDTSINPQVDQSIIEDLSESVEVINSNETSINQSVDQNQDNQLWQLLLDKDSYTAKTGEIVFLSGQILAVLQPDSPLADTTQTISNCHLKICLRDPQNFQILSEQIEAIPENSLPVNFVVTIAIPDAINTHLILGEISLNNQIGAILQQSFTISSPIADWLTALQDVATIAESQTNQFITPKPYRPTGIKPPSFINLVTAINPSIDQNALESLPPQISPISHPSQPGKHIDLPSFGNTPDESLLNTGKFAELLSSLTNLPTNTESSLEASAPIHPSATDQGLETVDHLKASADQISNISETDSSAIAENSLLNEILPEPASPVDTGFKRLNIEGHFMSRLNALTNDEELSDWLKTLLPPPLTENQIVVEEQIIEEALVAVPEEIAPVEIKAEDQEIVIIDDTWQEVEPITQRRKLQQLGNDLAEIQIPAPELQVLTPEIMPGRKVAVRILVPDTLQRVYVKLWVYDRQMQTIVYGPQWLTEFTPSSFQKLEVIHDLEVPYGCLELQFEAIAVEMTSNQESHKTIVERQVMPPPPPKLPLE